MYNFNQEFDDLIDAIYKLRSKIDSENNTLECRLTYLESQLRETRKEQSITKKHLKNMLEELGENNAE